jgi:cytosine/adenosine deaminase-related metal-dependent hydrolase
VAERRPASSGCHVHLAEDPIDIEASVEAFGVRPLERLKHFGLLGERALLAHGVHLEDEDYEEIARSGAVLIHNPESNANNGVGRLDVPHAADRGCMVGLGTDGMSSALLRALRFAFLTHRGAQRDPSAGFEALPQLLLNNATAARRFFPEPRLGKLMAGAPADLVVVDSTTPTPISKHNQFGHVVYGVSESPVRHTVARGRILLEDFHHTTLDPQEIAAHARELAPDLWERFHSLSWGTSFLGGDTGE